MISSANGTGVSGSLQASAPFSAESALKRGSPQAVQNSAPSVGGYSSTVSMAALQGISQSRDLDVPAEAAVARLNRSVHEAGFARRRRHPFPLEPCPGSVRRRLDRPAGRQSRSLVKALTGRTRSGPVNRTPETAPVPSISTARPGASSEIVRGAACRQPAAASAARKAISREGETGFRSAWVIEVFLSGSARQSLIFGPYEIDAVAPFQPADREMGLGDILKMVHEDRVDKAPPIAPMAGTPAAAAFSETTIPKRARSPKMKRTRTGRSLASVPVWR